MVYGNHVEGYGHTFTTASADYGYSTHIEGNENTVTDGVNNHVEGNQNMLSVAGGSANHVEGSANTATGPISFAHVEGHVCTTSASTTHVEGDSANGIREDQHVHASGKFATAGDAQTSSLEMRGSTPGSVPGETVELKYGASADQYLTLENGKYYAFDITAVAIETGGSALAVFKSVLYPAYQEAGAAFVQEPISTPNPLFGRFDVSGGVVSITSQNGLFASATYVGVGQYTINLDQIPGITGVNDIIPTGTVLSLGDVVIITLAPGFVGDHATIGVSIKNTSGDAVDESFYLHVDPILPQNTILNDVYFGTGINWLLEVAAGAGPARFALTFSTGTDTAAVKVVATVRWTEVLRS